MIVDLDTLADEAQMGGGVEANFVDGGAWLRGGGEVLRENGGDECAG